jgi:hypothetical protein
MTKWREYFDATFLKAEEMSKTGETFTLEHVDPGAVEEEETGAVKHQPVLIFEGGAKWGLNVTNRMLIEAMFGDEIEATVGKQITLYQTPCEVPGLYKGKPSIRILGSPELKDTMQVEITLRGKKGSRKPFTRTLVHTDAAVAVSDETEVAADVALPITREQVASLKAHKERLKMNNPDWHDWCKENIGKTSASDFTAQEAEAADDLLSLMTADDEIGL